MMIYLYFVLTLLIGAIFGGLVNKLKVPGGFMVGAIIGVAALSIVFNASHMPHQSRLFVQIIAGAFIGCTMEKSDLQRLPKIVKPTFIMLSGLLVLNLVGGVLVYLLSPLDLVTSFMSVVPGGISDTPIIAVDMGADGPKVAVMQLVRQVLGIGVFPAMIFAYDNRMRRYEEDDGDRKANTDKRLKSKTKSWQAFLCTITVAAFFGMLGSITGIPAGAFVLSIFSVLILKLSFDFAYVPRWAKQWAQILSGCYLGSMIKLPDVMELPHLLVPLFVIVLGYMANCFVTGRILSKTCGFTRKEGMLITTPAGASDMALISADMGVNNTDVIIMQVLRAVIVMTLFPQIINLILYIVHS